MKFHMVGYGRQREIPRRPFPLSSDVYFHDDSPKAARRNSHRQLDMHTRLKRNRLAPKTWNQVTKEAEDQAVADAEEPKDESWLRWFWPKPKPKSKPKRKHARISQNPKTLLTRESSLVWALSRQEGAVMEYQDLIAGNGDLDEKERAEAIKFAENYIAACDADVDAKQKAVDHSNRYW